MLLLASMRQDVLGTGDLSFLLLCTVPYVSSPEIYMILLASRVVLILFVLLYSEHLGNPSFYSEIAFDFL